ncbi:efflux RND transporter periplasmic adaptor subunit [Pontiella agarivorans]|uniref:Efflux RND transporter periplasmic adaptor subunit n=1 Tax=Pontiella agarivorans TaxID=3038953 RepID=A0ABU5N279_9BACT|nr:efflux RND transporter periplasmic adaptor subunit [Pontiella agarivorans]MDZ8120356.1 efflux RND transporter periplasmic adaptor subunit [Pontiella agarivorans]
MSNPKKKLLSKRSVLIGLAVALVAVAVLLLNPGNDTNKIDMDEANLCQVQQGDLVVSILQSGELRAKKSRDIQNQAYRDAKITSIVDDGAFVTNGQLLFELESAQLQERYLDQQSDVAEAEASLKLAIENLAIAKLKNATDLETAKMKAELARMDLQKYVDVEYQQQVDKAQSEIYLAEQELKKARNELAGTQELYDKGYSNRTELEADQLGVERKEVEVKNKKADLEILKNYTHIKRQMELKNAVSNAVSALERMKKSQSADIQSKEAGIESKKTRLEIERNQLATKETEFSNTKVYADFDGQVFYPKERHRPKIEKGATVQMRQKILSYPDLSAWNLQVGIPEAMIDKVSVGQHAVATLDALPGLILEGNIEKVSAVPDSQNWFSSGVKTYTIMIDVTSETNTQLKPGMSATVEIVTDELKNVLYVPIQAVVSRDGTHYVYVVNHGRKELREVEIGKFNTYSIEIVSGLEVGEELLLYAEVELEADAQLKKSPLDVEEKGRAENSKSEARDKA